MGNFLRVELAGTGSHGEGERVQGVVLILGVLAVREADKLLKD